MDEVERVIRFFEEAGSDVGGKLDALLDLDQFHEPRVVTFLLGVVASRHEAPAVRQASMKQLCKDGLSTVERGAAVNVLADVVAETDSTVAPQAAEALGDSSTWRERLAPWAPAR